MNQAETFFGGWEETLIWSCLQGHMGTMILDDNEDPTSALIDVGDFCFLSGQPSTELLNKIKGAKLIIPKYASWENVIETFFGERAEKTLRYAIKKEPDVFDKTMLHSLVNSLDSRYELKPFDNNIFDLAKNEPWSADLCSQFKDYNDYKTRAVGVAILYNGKLVAGASPYGVYDNGIEIEIDTHPGYRRRGLATVCGAKLILECLSRGLYPSWDAHDLHSVALAEKLGYHLSHPYVTYELINN